MPRRWRLLPNDPEIGWIPYVWLFYLGFVFLVPVFGGFAERGEVWIASGVATAVFLPLYFAGYWVGPRRQWWIALAIAALAAALTPINVGSNTFFIFSAYFAGRSGVTVRRAGVRVGIVVALTVLTAVLLAPTIYFWGPAVLGAAAVGFLGVFAHQRSMRVAELRMARAEVEALARIAERERIAGDLHDLLGHTLSVIALKSELAQRLVTRDAARAEHEMADVHAVARQALAQVRTAVGGYRVGSGAGMLQELASARTALEAAGVALVVTQGPERIAARLDASHEGVVALAVREAATNVMRHARATTCWISFFMDEASFGVEIRDDGRGFVGSPGQGLSAMRRRVEALGGSLEVGGGAGTVLRLTFLEPGADRPVSSPGRVPAEDAA